MKKKFDIDEEELFCRIANHMLFQGRKSQSPDRKSCRYRSEDDLSCAVGCMIPDSRYNPEIELKPVTDPIVRRCLPFKTEGVLSLLFALQEVHDNFRVDEWESRLKEIAEDHYFQWPPAIPERGLEGLNID